MILRLRTAERVIHSVFYYAFVVVVCFNHQRIGLTAVEVGAFGDDAGVGGDGEVGVFESEEEAAIIGAIVRCFKRGNQYVVEALFVLFEDGHVVIFDAARNLVSAQNSFQTFDSGMQFHARITAQDCITVAHMVAVVVSELYPADG